MKTLFFIIFCMITFCNNTNGQSFQMPIIDGNVYIYEFAIKRPGRANLGFIIVESNSYQDISFDIHFSKNKINKVNKTVSSVYIDNNIVGKLGNCYYSSDDFAKKRRLIPDTIYKMISSTFFEISNEERLVMLSKLAKNNIK